MKLKVTVNGTVNQEELLNDIGVNESKELLAYAGARAYDKMKEFVPLSLGHNTKDGFIQGGRLRTEIEMYPDSEGYIIEFTQPYARYQYYGIRADGTHEVYNYTTEGTGPYWDVVMMSVKGEEFLKELNDYIKEKNK